MPNQKPTVCPQCSSQNRFGAKFCATCGRDLTSLTVDPVQVEAKVTPTGDRISRLRQRGTEGLEAIVEATRDVLRRGAKTESPPAASPSLRPATQGAPTARPVPARQGAVSPSLPGPLPVGTMIEKRAVVLRVYPLSRSTYYDVYDVVCGECHYANSAGAPGVCQKCQAPLPTYLLHHTASSGGNLSVPDMVQLSSNSPYIVQHYLVQRLPDRTYVWLHPVPQWRSLLKVKTPVDLEQAVFWAGNVALAFDELGGRYHDDFQKVSLEHIVIDGTVARLADLSRCESVPADQAAARLAQNQRFLAKLLCYLLTGYPLPRESTRASIPVPIVPVIDGGIQGRYTALADMINDLRIRSAKGSYGLNPKPSTGSASDAGHIRAVNEDSLVAFQFTRVQESQGVPVGFYAVADGMGGHQAGEIASRTVNMVITERVLNAQVLPGLTLATRRLDETPVGVITSAVKKANQVLYEHARTHGSDMGTTITAALVIGDMATVANVGDSRTYLYREHHLYQMTQDHSLVASLVAANIIRPEEVRTHPQRNQIYRTLGAKPDVEVDVFTKRLQRGDRLLLCSDGLWEMVTDDIIAQVLNEFKTAQAACDALIRSANQHGGEDNITVIVVDME